MDGRMIKLTFAGDAMCEGKQADAHKTGENSYDFLPVFESMRQYFNNSDFVIVNMETPLAGKERGFTSERWSFNTPGEFALALKESGVDMVSTANNHCLDRGVDGLVSTIENLDKIGLKHTGTFKEKTLQNYIIEDLAGIKVGFLSYTYGTNAFMNRNYLGKGEKYLVNMLQEQELDSPLSRWCYLNERALYSRIYRKMGRLICPEQFKKPVYERRYKCRRRRKELVESIKRCRSSGAEYIVMLMHAGGQFNPEPNEHTLEISDFLLNNDVDAVIGNHEHVIHRCEIKDNKVTAFSLGNFSAVAGIYDPPFGKKAEYSIILNLHLAKEGTEVRLRKTTFSVAKSIAADSNRVKTELLFDLIARCNDEKEKEKLLADNEKIVCLFLNKKNENMKIKREYEFLG
ncbi:MAG TPA: CapA family protein [bacterium]|nr:CapA family protein [bacterium]